jgi:hypothetical protein
MQNNNSKILLSFDVEEFDLPLEYGEQISMNEQMEVGKKGLDAIADLLNKHNVQTTLFTTANFADHFTDTIKQLSQQHEIASHTYYHSSFKNEDLFLSKKRLEEITNTKVTGLRMPRLRKVDLNEVKNAGYEYDSSINPTWLPGRYNNFNLPRTVYKEDNLTRLPASVSPNFRIPLFWLSFKNLPYAFFKKLALQTLKKDGYICLYFHPWEFIHIEKYKIPAYTKRGSKNSLLQKLNVMITDFKKEGEFITIQSFLQQKSPAKI